MILFAAGLSTQTNSQKKKIEEGRIWRGFARSGPDPAQSARQPAQGGQSGTGSSWPFD
jgi:hypothetical protein